MHVDNQKVVFCFIEEMSKKAHKNLGISAATPHPNPSPEFQERFTSQKWEGLSGHVVSANNFYFEKHKRALPKA